MAAELTFRGKKGRPVVAPRPFAPLADTHGHLTSFRRTNVAEALVRAALAGVRLLVVPVDPTDDVQDVPAFLCWWDSVIDQARTILERKAAYGVVPVVFDDYDVPSLFDNLYFIAGVHPYGARALLEDPAARARLDALLCDPRCIGVGEIGLDFGPWNEVPAGIQEEALRIQLRLARARQLPVELHIRDAADDTQATAHQIVARVVGGEGVPGAGLDLHCFTCGPEVMEPFVSMGCHIAFGGALTFGRSDDIRAAAALCPAKLMLSETDCPYMAPVPLRGQECEPAMVAFTVARLASLRSEPADVVYRQLWENACVFFSLKKHTVK